MRLRWSSTTTGCLSAVNPVLLDVRVSLEELGEATVLALVVLVMSMSAWATATASAAVERGSGNGDVVAPYGPLGPNGGGMFEWNST